MGTCDTVPGYSGESFILPDRPETEGHFFGNAPPFFLWKKCRVFLETAQLQLQIDGFIYYLIIFYRLVLNNYIHPWWCGGEA
jgi:hypothetical protein